MEQVSDKSSFQIILQSNNVDDLSEYWQDQCKYFYDELSSTLPEGSIKPLTLNTTEGGKAPDLIFFSSLVINELPAKLIAYIFVEALIESIKQWHQYRQSANISVKHPDGSILEISKQFLSKLLKYSKENSQLSIFEVLNHFKNSKE